MLTTRKNFLQQTGFTIAGSLLPFSKLFSNAATLSENIFAVDLQTPIDYTKDLRNPLFTNPAYIKEAGFQYHKGTYAGIAKDVLYKEEESLPCIEDVAALPLKSCDVTNHHFYGNGNPDNDISILRYYAFYPTSTYEDSLNGHEYDAMPLPCVAIYHPGGFQECPDYLQPGIITMCQQLAARGFIAITIDYRAGRIKDDILTDRASAQQQLAPYRGIQDGRGAIRTIFKRNAETNRGGHNFRINTNQFFVGGQSAGAVVAMGIAYYRTQAMINQAFAVINTSLTVEDALGPMDADYYYGEPGNPAYFPRIRGVVNCWGGITIPKTFDSSSTYPNPDLGKVEKDFFLATSGETANKINPPMIGFAGTLDETIPFPDDPSLQDIINSKNSKFRGENLCFNEPGDFILKNPGNGPVFNVFVKQCSALNIYYVLKELGRFTECYVDCNMGHGIKNVATDNFGLDANGSTKDDVFTYIAIRTAVFFQSCIVDRPVNGAYPTFNYRGKSLFRSTLDKTEPPFITNQRKCDECDGVPATDVCNFAEDPECD